MNPNPNTELVSPNLLRISPIVWSISYEHVPFVRNQLPTGLYGKYRQLSISCCGCAHWLIYVNLGKMEARNLMFIIWMRVKQSRCEIIRKTWWVQYRFKLLFRHCLFCWPTRKRNRIFSSQCCTLTFSLAL